MPGTGFRPSLPAASRFQGEDELLERCGPENPPENFLAINRNIANSDFLISVGMPTSSHSFRSSIVIGFARPCVSACSAVICKAGKAQNVFRSAAGNRLPLFRRGESLDEGECPLERTESLDDGLGLRPLFYVRQTPERGNGGHECVEQLPVFLEPQLRHPSSRRDFPPPEAIGKELLPPRLVFEHVEYADPAGNRVRLQDGFEVALEFGLVEELLERPSARQRHQQRPNGSFASPRTTFPAATPRGEPGKTGERTRSSAPRKAPRDFSARNGRVMLALSHLRWGCNDAMADSLRFSDNSPEHPRIAFRDPYLRSCSIERDALGQPRAWAGSFAVVYKGIDETGNPLAIRVFSTESPQRRGRYEQITEYLANRRLDCLVSFEYRDEEIRSLSDGKRYPIVLMDWVEGETLFQWVQGQCRSAIKRHFGSAGEQWPAVVAELWREQIAHGDLQHANIMVTPQGELKLVDYDGMCVPALSGADCLEVGTPPYQHPQRNLNVRLSLRLDDFSALVIYVGLQALADDPALWRKYVEKTNNDKLLFREDDFRFPQRSALRHDLLNSARLSCPQRLRQPLRGSGRRYGSSAAHWRVARPAANPLARDSRWFPRSAICHPFAKSTTSTTSGECRQEADHDTRRTIDAKNPRIRDNG